MTLRDKLHAAVHVPVQLQSNMKLVTAIALIALTLSIIALVRHAH